jgi:hypothetical protein
MYRLSRNQLNTYNSDTKRGAEAENMGLEVECGESSVDRVMASIDEHSNVHNNLHIKI